MVKTQLTATQTDRQTDRQTDMQQGWCLLVAVNKCVECQSVLPTTRQVQHFHVLIAAPNIHTYVYYSILNANIHHFRL